MMPVNDFAYIEMNTRDERGENVILNIRLFRQGIQFGNSAVVRLTHV